jgi:hypothetical protein
MCDSIIVVVRRKHSDFSVGLLNSQVRGLEALGLGPNLRLSHTTPPKRTPPAPNELDLSFITLVS